MHWQATYSDAQRLDATAQADFVIDEDAFRDFYARTSRGVWAYLVRLVGDRASAEDLLQDGSWREYSLTIKECLPPSTINRGVSGGATCASRWLCSQKVRSPSRSPA